MMNHRWRCGSQIGVARLVLATVAIMGPATASMGQFCQQQQSLAASDAAANDEFGISVSISGDTAVVGARRDDNATGVDAGAAYVYVRTGPPGSELWTQQAKLIGDEPQYSLEAGSESGISVAISGDTAIVGSWLWGSAAGLAYVFVRSDSPQGPVWTQQAVLWAPFGTYQYYGYAVALEGNTALVGSLVTPFQGGAAYFATRSGPPGSEGWSQQAVYPSDGVPGDQFGNSVAISPSQTTAIVGAYMEDNAGGTDAGSAYVFVKSGNTWIQQAKLIATDGAMDDRFGVKVAISGDVAMVGAYQDDHAGGADAGSVYVFTRSGTVWTQQAKLTASDAAAGDYFGTSLALSSDALVVGAHGDDSPSGLDAGAAYVFTPSGPPGSPGGQVWSQQFKLASPAPAADDWFGAAVALDGDTPVVGARQDDHSAGGGGSVINAGSMYVYTCLELGPTCPADVSPAGGDDAVNINDLLEVINNWGSCALPCPPRPVSCAADISPIPAGDCAVNINDLLEVINSWGPCP